MLGCRPRLDGFVIQMPLREIAARLAETPEFRRLPREGPARQHFFKSLAKRVRYSGECNTP
jgi:hypothetical protein